MLRRSASAVSERGLALYGGMIGGGSSRLVRLLG